MAYTTIVLNFFVKETILFERAGLCDWGGGDFLARTIIVSRDAVMKTGSELRSPFQCFFNGELQERGSSSGFQLFRL